MGGSYSSTNEMERRGSDRLKKKMIHAQDDMVNKILDADKVSLDENSVETEENENTSKEVEEQKKENTPSLVEDVVDFADAKSRRSMMTRRSRELSFELDSTFLEAMSTDASEFQFPFENLVFEGGGIKGYAYCGACSILEEYGVMKQIKRLAGTSSGSLYAALLAIGYTSREVTDIITPEFAALLKTHKFGYLSLLPNIFKSFGWNSFGPFYRWMGDRFKEKTGNPDITFYELYQDYQRELCVVVTNLNMMREEYFHPKTTPDVPIRMAVRMSMTLPGLFQPVKYHHHGNENTYIDGAVLCNYPIHAFDGWWLSMKMEDRFLKRLQPLSECVKLYRHEERFGKANPHTLGFKIYSHDGDELDRTQLEEQTPLQDSLPIPDTKLGKRHKKHSKMEHKTVEQHTQIMNAVDAFLKALEKHNTSHSGFINRTELENALLDEAIFPKRYAQRLFGENVSVDEVFDALDRNGNGTIQLDELLYFIERTGVNIASRMFGHRWNEVDNVWSFLVQLQRALLLNMMERTFRPQDVERTVGINTCYLNTTDFDLEQGDKDFLFEEGRRRTDAFLRHYIVTKRPKRKRSFQQEFIEEEDETEDNDAGIVFEEKKEKQTTV